MHNVQYIGHRVKLEKNRTISIKITKQKVFKRPIAHLKEVRYKRIIKFGSKTHNLKLYFNISLPCVSRHIEINFLATCYIEQVPQEVNI